MIWIKVAEETRPKQGSARRVANPPHPLPLTVPGRQDTRAAMADDDDRDEMLRGMAANRGCKLVKSRRRTPGVGDYGRYGLRDAKTGQDVYGFGSPGLTATSQEIEDYLRGGLRASWKQSLRAAPEIPQSERKAAPRRDAPADKARPKPKRAPSPPPPPPARPPKPKLTIREAAPRDAEAISKLLGELGFPSDAGALRRRLPVLSKAGTPPLVADEAAVIGVLSWHVMPVLHRPTPVGRVSMMVVAEEARGRGVGAALLAEAERRIAAAGCALVEVTSNIELGDAHAFYRAHGYERTSYRFAKTLIGPA
jgi:ribosomal protein S18 acetylase RimI-like enzyme